MSYRSLVLAVAALSSMHVTNADAQSVYVAPGGVYVGSGPVYVIPAPNNGAPPYVAPTYGYEYGPPAVAILRERSLRRPLRLRPAILLLSHATRWAVRIAAGRASSLSPIGCNGESQRPVRHRRLPERSRSCALPTGSLVMASPA